MNRREPGKRWGMEEERGDVPSRGIHMGRGQLFFVLKLHYEKHMENEKSSGADNM